MSAENNYQQILEEVCEKLNNINPLQESDISEIKQSVEKIGQLITSTQAKVNFQDIKEKLETIAFQVDSTNDTLLKDLYNDINTLKASTENVSQYLDNIQNVQNMALTRAEFDEYQKHQFDLALKSNENIFSELRAIKANANMPSSCYDGMRNISGQLETLHNALTRYIDEIAESIKAVPNINDISNVVSELNNVQTKNVKQTNVLIKEVQAELLKFHSDFQGKEFVGKLSQISEIYDSLDVINS